VMAACAALAVLAAWTVVPRQAAPAR